MGHEEIYDRESEYHRDMIDSIPKKTIVLLNGNMAQQSAVDLAFSVVCDEMEANGFECEIVNLSDYPDLPIFQTTMWGLDSKLSQELIALFEDASAFIVATPEYHGSMSGALKNFVDHMNPEVFKGKPIALISYAGNVRGGHAALVHMRDMFRSLHAKVIPAQVTFAKPEVLQDGVNRYLVNHIHNRLIELSRQLRSEV